MSENDWTLEGVKVDDLIIVDRGGRDETYIRKVDKVTKTQVTCGASRFLIRNGSLVGADQWSRICARKATPERLTKAKSDSSKRWLRDLRTNELAQKLAVEDIEQIRAFVEAALAKAEGKG